VTDQMRDALEQLAQRGDRRGADVVREAALGRASRRRIQRRAAVTVLAVLAVAVLTSPLWWPARHQSSTGVVTTPPDIAAPPVRSVDIEMPLATTDGWRPVLTIPYGPGNEQLGVDRKFGPPSAKLSADSFIVLDTNKGRLAYYGDDGAFTGATPLPGGAQFVSAVDGGIVISGGPSTWVLPSGSSQWLAAATVGPHSDQTRVYCCDDTSALSIQNGRPVVAAAQGELTSDGRRFHVHRDAGPPPGGHVSPMLEVRFLDPQPHTTRLNFRVDGASAPVDFVTDYAADGYGNIDVFVYGTDAQDQLRAALVTITQTGEVLPVTAAPSPFGATETGPYHLTTGAGDARLVIGGASGLEVWAPSPLTDPAAVPRAMDLATAARCDTFHEQAFTADSGADGSPQAIVACRIGEARMAIEVYADTTALEAAIAADPRRCGTRVIGDRWIVHTNTLEASTLVAQRLGGQVEPADNC